MKKIRNHGNADDILGLLIAAGAFLVYLRTMSSHVGTEDPGEIATTLHGMGILHPTGYPLYTMMGSLFARLPLGDTVIWRLNLFGAVLTAAATFLFHRTFVFLLSDEANRLFGWRGGHTTRSSLSPLASKAAPAVATVIFAFSAVYWSEAVWLEVYALHLVFLALVTRLYLGALAVPGDMRRWVLFAYVLGLSFAHHMMTVLLAPAFLVLFFQVHGFGRAAWSRIALAAPSFVLALTAYLYLPLRSAAGPLMNWGEPTTPGALWKHVTAAQYGGQMFSSLDVAVRKLAQFMADLPADFGYAPLALAALGLWVSRKAPRLLLFSALVFAAGLFYAINYAFDDPNFHLNPHFMVALWAGFGAHALLAWTAKGMGRIPARAAVTAIALSPLVFNYPILDKSRDALVEDYARNVLESMDSGAVLFSNEYERLGSPAFYLQNVEGFRGDVAVLDIILLGNPWYYGHLEQRVPWLMEASRAEIEAFRAEMDSFLETPDNSAELADSAEVKASLAEMFHAIVAQSRAAGRPVYVTAGINPAIIERYQHAPTGMVFRLLEPDDTTRIALRQPRFRPLPKSNRLTPIVRSDYAQSYAYQGAALAQRGDTAGAVAFLVQALQLLPDFPDAKAYLTSLDPSGRHRARRRTAP